MIDLYRLYDHDGNLLYIGISLSAAHRAGQHRAIKPWWSDVRRIEIEKLSVGTRVEAEQFERAAIRREKPRYNVVHAPGDVQLLPKELWNCRSCGKPVHSGFVVVHEFTDRSPNCDMRRCAGLKADDPVPTSAELVMGTAVHPCLDVGWPCNVVGLSEALAYFRDLWVTGNTGLWHVEHLLRKCTVRRAPADFVLDIDVARLVATRTS